MYVIILGIVAKEIKRLEITMNDNKEFKPYISADKKMPELTVKTIIIGVLLSVIFGAANAYLGLRVGMTVSASIPAAVIGMGVIKGIFRKDSVLEGNMIQTIGSAGESLAAGAIFTLPALFMWANEGAVETPSLIEITLIALFGGLLGILFMVPLRKALIVKEHGVLPYPEGTACAEVMLAGEKGGNGAGKVFLGMGIAAAVKFIVDGLKMASGVITLPVKKLKTAVSAQVYPALISVGYICGPKIASYMLAGGILSWLVFIPLIGIFGAEAKMFPMPDMTVSEVYAMGGADAIWSYYIKYIGAGAVAAGGIISLIKTLPIIVKTFGEAVKGLKGSKTDNSEARTDKDLPLPIILAAILIIAVLITIVPAIPVNFVGALLIVVFGFFFATVSSRMVGLVGSSNNPVSGMAIATLLVSTIILKATGMSEASIMMGAIAIGSIICIVAAIAGDTSQDLKSGYILGATPKKQQIGEIIGVVAAALAIGGVLYLLNETGYGGKDLPASQATLMKTIVEGVAGGQLPWGLVFVGAFTAIVIEILGISVLPVAIGIYLPLELSTTIMIGGIIRWIVDKKKYDSQQEKEQAVNNGVLCCSGMIAGEGLVGILIAIFVVIKVNKTETLADIIAKVGDKLNFGIPGGIAVIALIVFTIFRFVWGGKRKKSNEEK